MVDINLEILQGGIVEKVKKARFFGCRHIEYEYLMAFMRYFISTFCVLSFLLLWTAFAYFRPFNTNV